MKMNFIKNNFDYLKKEKKLQGMLILLFIFYISINFRHILLLNKEGIIQGPFDYTGYHFNIFNFDPTQYAHCKFSTIVHPFFNFIVAMLKPINKSFFAILIVNSIIVTLTVSLIYIFSRELDLNEWSSCIIALLFGVFSYSINSTLVADSYVYAQFFLVLSILYIQYSYKNNSYSILGHAIMAVFNFGITSTNIIPYGLAVFINNLKSKKRNVIKKIILSIIVFVVITVVLVIIQNVVFKYSWIYSMKDNVKNSGINYIDRFQLRTHYKIIYMLLTGPIITTPLRVMDATKGIVTDISITMPSYINIITVIVMITLFFAFVCNIKEKMCWILVMFPLSSFILHIIIGFGLGTYEYDMYLYAGHYIFVIPMFIALLLKKMECMKNIQNIIKVVIVFLIIVLLINNIVGQNNLLNLLKKTYFINF